MNRTVEKQARSLGSKVRFKSRAKTQRKIPMVETCCVTAQEYRTRDQYV